MLSIIIPTFNEADNVNVIAREIKEAMKDSPYEIIFVDDSRDDTPKLLEELTQQDECVRFLHRENERGLGTAVVRGFELAKGNYVTVMDADLQHPPSMLLPMLTEMKTGVDMVIPSRFVPGGSDGGLKIHRKIVSGVARYMSKFALKELRYITDPTGGFFMFRRDIIDGVTLQPIGWKILIEVLIRGDVIEVSEIPYQFNPRVAGESKMSLTEQMNYIKHLRVLKRVSRNKKNVQPIVVNGS